MKTTEMIARVTNANNVTILSVRGLPIGWESMRDLGHTLYTLVDMVQEDSGMYRLFEKDDGALVIAPTAKAEIVGPHKISYPLEFDSFGELENWSKVTEEEATLLRTKAPVEPPKDEPGVDLFKQVFDLLGLNYDEYGFYGEPSEEFVQFVNYDNYDLRVEIIFDKGLVQVIKGKRAEPPRKLKISFATEPTQATQPLRDWLKLNASPNIVAVVNGTQAGLFEGIAQVNDELKPS